jgi:hypothetical protein
MDTIGLRSELKRAATEYERAIRRLAPRRMTGRPSTCDEIVGRFCLTYDIGPQEKLPEEPEAVKRVRSGVIDVFQKAARLLPRDTTIAAPLIRYLVEAGRTDDAVHEAEAFAQGKRNDAWSNLLLGLALHYAKRTADAEHAFERALAQLPEREARRARDVNYLLHSAERSAFKRLADSAQTRYLNDYWRIADPLYLTAGNETRTEHFARYVYSRILARAPVVLGSVSWGDDLEELTRRFGVPAARTQGWDTGTGFDLQITEHFDPEQLTYAPTRLSKNRQLAPPLPGAPWPYDTVAERNGFAPKTVRAMRTLEHQLSRFPGTTTRLRIDLQMRLDSLVQPGAAVEVAFFAADSLMNILGEARDTVTAQGTLAVASLEMDVPSGALVYSVEARELETHLAARARYELPLPNGALPALSDLVLLHGQTEPNPRRRGDPGFAPLSSLVIGREQPLALYLEVVGLASDASEQARYRIDLEVVPTNPPGAVARAFKGIGRRFGLGTSVLPRITWTETADGKSGLVPVLLQIGSLRDKSGLQTLRVTVTDLVSGAWSTAQRTVRIRRD